jgi:amino acid adenylation domain-containing protein
MAVIGVEVDAMQSRIIEQVVEIPGESASGHVVVDSKENGTGYPRDKTIHALFEEQAALTPDSVAIEFEDRRLSYRALNEQANRVAHRLIGLGVGRGTRVGLCMERSPELIVGILAILKAGGAYVPLDPEYPYKRLAFLIRDIGTALLVAHTPTASRLAPSLRLARVFWIESVENDSTHETATNPEIATSAEDLAYIMYTSGSTGMPKGVMVTHRGVVRLVRNTNYCQFGSAEVFLQLAPISFDASTFEIWGALLNGGRLAIMPPRSTGLDELGTAIRQHGVTTLWLTAGLFHLMVEQRVEDLRPLRQLLAGGDVLSPRHVQKALDTLEDGVIINGYGPTESTTFACCHRMTKGYQTGSTIPIGGPISNTTVHVLDDEHRPVPTGSPGELWIGGDGVARGYLNQPELTRQKFVADPYSSLPDARLYRTGDLARLRPDGMVEFLGRLDNQVKIAGHRIEPGEIEAALRQHPDVRQSAVVADAGPRGEKRLVAYVVGANAANVEAAELKDFLGRHLPAYMIPSVFANVDLLPLSPNGKLDRSALPPVEQAEFHDASTDDSCTRLTELERAISGIWQQVLNRGVGPEDNFFDLGGDSLQLIEVHSELQMSLGRNVSIMDLFEFTTVRSLADRLDHEQQPEPALIEAQERASRQRQAIARQKPAKVLR